MISKELEAAQMIMTMKSPSVEEVPYFDRVHYFYGQMLGVREFRVEQEFFREKMKLQNRCLHGYGTVCGLELVPGEPATSPCDPPREKEPPPPTWVRIKAGFALDCDGNELLVRSDNFSVDVWSLLSADDKQKVIDEKEKNGKTSSIWIFLCYQQHPLEPSRPVLADPCGASPDCQYRLLRDGVTVKVTASAPEPDLRCDSCCTPCPDSCLLLARIDDFERGKQLNPDGSDIHNEVRRLLALRTPTRIKGLSWTTGATYTKAETDQLLAVDPDDPNNAGLVIEFTRPVKVATLIRGIIDLWVIRIGRGQGSGGGEIENWEGEFVGLPPVNDGSETVKRVVFRSLADEEMQPGDRMLITVRTGFILDDCCRPVDGENVGGRVPVLNEFKEKYDRSSVVNPKGICGWPNTYGGWTSGNGAGGWFQSWFYAAQSQQGSRAAAVNR
jgi:hypothetical protein